MCTAAIRTSENLTLRFLQSFLNHCKICTKYHGIKLESALHRQEHKIYCRILTSFAQRQNRSFHFMERVRIAAKCIKIKYARAKWAKLLFFIVKYTKLWRSCCRPLLVCWNSLLSECFFERVSKCNHYFVLCAGTQWLIQFVFHWLENSATNW